MSALNPDKIERVTVLKDKSATELYGEKGKNGVLLITLKQGTPGIVIRRDNEVTEELTNQEIAERMNLSVNTVKTHYTEALKMLRIHLSKMLIIVTFVTLMTYLSVHYLR